MTTDTFAHIPLAHIVASTTNPRKTFDQAKLQELADSIRASGVHQPVLVRPLPAARVPDTAGMDPRPQWELVSGERRLRASTLAGAATIPAMVRALTDAQVLEIQLVENLQRTDLSELEEAEGYDHLMRHAQDTGHTLDAQALADKIGKSKSYVYARLKLLDLCTEAREALRIGPHGERKASSDNTQEKHSGLDASRALLIARIPDHALQIKALDEVTRLDWYGAPEHSHRSAAQHIQSNYMLRLADARFAITSATLVPTAGSCKACPKRTGAAPDLFADVKSADTCTDPACYRAKEAAHQAAQLAAAHERGQTVVVGKEAQALMRNSYNTELEGHLRLDNVNDSPTDEPLRKLIGKAMEQAGILPVLIEVPSGPQKGELVAAVPIEQAAPLLAAAGHQQAAKEVQRDALQDQRNQASQSAHQRKADYEAAWRKALAKAIAAKAVPATGNTPPACIALHDDGTPTDTVTVSVALLRYLARSAVGPLSAEQGRTVAKHLGLGAVAPQEGIREHIDNAPALALPGLLLLCLTARDTEHRAWLGATAEEQNPALHLAAELLAIDIKAIQAATKAEQTAKIKAQAAKEKAKEAKAETKADTKGVKPETKAAKPETKRGKPGTKPAKPKTTPEAAQAGIAQALQAAEQKAEQKPDTRLHARRN